VVRLQIVEMSNNGLFNGMQMPLFTAANQQQANVDDVDFQDLFREYFNEEPMAQLQAQAQAAMNTSLPTGTGIRTAFHGGAEQHQQQQQQPPMKRSRVEENLYLSMGGIQNTVGLGGMSSQQLGNSSGSALTNNLNQAQQFQQQLQQQLLAQQTVNNLNAGMVGGTSTGISLTNSMYGAAPIQAVDKEALEKQMTAERKLRNREHAKRSRVRKKFMIESLQEQVRKLQVENSDLRLLVQKHIPDNALKIIDMCCSSSPLFGLPEREDGDERSGKGNDKTALIQTDFSLIQSLTSGQQNFVLSDPRLPDNPIVFATPGFYELTGYTRDQVLGRNCRFLQGPGTDPAAVDVIRSAIAKGNDATVCILNYKADGTPFWNQFFVAALRDSDNCIVNYVGVQTLVEPNAGASALEEKVNAIHPIRLGQEDEEDDAKDI